MVATLDGWIEGSDAIFEAKFMLPWSFSEEAAADKYMPLWVRTKALCSIYRGAVYQTYARTMEVLEPLGVTREGANNVHRFSLRAFKLPGAGR